jgi:OFA family oxalate/formate antiporter-like MFS transporter
MSSVKKQGLRAVVAASAIQLTVGIAYIWSVFQTGVANSIFGGDNAAASLTFSLLLALLTVGSVVGGKLAVKYSTKLVVFVGGLILAAGFFLAAFANASNAWLLWLTYGVMGGFGMGFTYSTTIACVQKWYPHKKGMVTGILVSAIGFGGVVFTPIITKLIDVFGGEGAGEPATFMVLSVVFLVVCSVGSLFMVNPVEGYTGVETDSATAAADKKTEESVQTNKATAPVAPRSYTTSEMLRMPQYYLATFTLLLACMGGLMMIGFAKPIADAKGLAAAATVGVLAISMSNSMGRLLWGMISDKLGRNTTMLVLLAGSAVLSLFVNLAVGYWVFVLIALIGFFYGGIIGTFPSLTADLFGPKYMATNYGFVLLGFGAGAIISSQIAGHYRNVAVAGGDINLMFPAFLIASACTAAGLVMMVVLRMMEKKKA